VNCPSELTCSMYADGELSGGEARDVRLHLDTCTHCRALVDGLMCENRMLIQILQDTSGETVPAADTPLEPSRRRVLRSAALILGFAAGLYALLGFLEGIPVPTTLDWINPFRSSGQLNFFITTILYVAQGGVSTMASIITVASVLALMALIIGCAPLFIRRRKIAAAALGLAALTLTLSLPSYALETRRSNQVVTVQAGETIDDTLFAAAETITVDGTINGDLIAFARRAVIRGTVKGSMLFCGQLLEIEGTVEGSVLGFGQSVHTRGRVLRNLYAFGQSIGLDTAGNVGGNVTAFGSETLIDGTVARDLTTFGNVTDLRGTVGRNLVVRGERVSVLAPARVGGNLVAHVKRADAVQVQSGATVAGKTDVQIEQSRNRYGTLSFYLWQLVHLAAALATGLLLFWLAPSVAGIKLETSQASLIAGGVGFLAVVATPIAVVILSITLVGLPIALISLFLWLAGLYLAKIVVGAFVGRSLFQGSRFLTLLVGLALIFVAVNIPYIGWIVNILLTLLGLGAMILRLWHRERPLAG
jgi:hypothetical protein